MRITAHIDDKLGERLKQFIEEKYRGRHGTLSWVVEEAIRQYLEREA